MKRKKPVKMAGRNKKASGMDAFREWVYKKSFGTPDRIKLYEGLMVLIENRVILEQALRKMYDVHSKHGTQPQAPMAILTGGCIATISSGRPLSDALEEWIPQQEAALLRAGEEAGDIINALNECIRLIDVKLKIKASIIKAISYPSVLFSLTAVLLVIVATQVVPKMSKVSRPDSWGGAGQALYFVSNMVTEHGMTLLCSVFFCIAWFFVSLPKQSLLFRGSVRIFLDGLPPWSLYRIMLGSTFLLNVALLLKSGVQLQKALMILSKNASPWMRQRIDAINYGISMGNNLGLAMQNAGYNFPDKEAIQYLVILSDTDGVDEVLDKFANRWVDTSIKTMDAIAGKMLVMGLMLFGLVMILVLLGANDMASSLGDFN